MCLKPVFSDDKLEKLAKEKKEAFVDVVALFTSTTKNDFMCPRSVFVQLFYLWQRI